MSELSAGPYSRQDEWSPTVEVIDEQHNSIQIRLGKLKHGHKIRLGSFVLVYSRAERVKSFGASCIVSCSDLPFKIEDKLQFRVSVSEPAPDKSSTETKTESPDNAPNESQT